MIEPVGRGTRGKGRDHTIPSISEGKARGLY